MKRIGCLQLLNLWRAALSHGFEGPGIGPGTGGRTHPPRHRTSLPGLTRRGREMANTNTSVQSERH